MAFQNILPDPNNNIAPAGNSDGTGNAAGPGYASVSLSSVLPSITTRTNSGSTIVRNIAGHKWQLSISYNPLTRAQFEPLYTFLIQKKGSGTHFFVELPQYKNPQNSTFTTFVGSNNFAPTGDLTSGVDNFLISNGSYNSGSNGTPSVGDIFSITDTNDTNHKKVYMITRVETSVGADNETSPAPSGVTQLRIHCTPPLQKAVQASTTTIKFKDVQFRVINTAKDTGYSLDVDNLYKLSLKLEEAQP